MSSEASPYCGTVYEAVNKLQVEGKVPSSAEEGWMRDEKNAAKRPKFAQTGWC